MTLPVVDIGFAASQSAPSNWWSQMMTALLAEVQGSHVYINMVNATASALPDWNKNQVVGSRYAPETEKNRNDLTDANRNVVTDGFMTGSESGKKAEWLMWFDDDVIPPIGVISRLLALKKPFVAGLYYNSHPPFNPIAYMRYPDGIGYMPIYDYPEGALMPVDSVGMGCTLIHRDVYQAILDHYELFTRPNGSLVAIHKDDMLNVNIAALNKLSTQQKIVYNNGWLCMRAEKPGLDDRRLFPFYAMEYGRTEDHHFCEMAIRVGHRPYVDTTITCKHHKYKEIDRDTYNRYRVYRQLQGSNNLGQSRLDEGEVPVIR